MAGATTTFPQTMGVPTIVSQTDEELVPFEGDELLEWLSIEFPAKEYKEFAMKGKLNAARRNALPKSSFAYVDSKGVGHLPYKDKNGKVDPTHVRNALARLNQVKGLAGAAAARAKSKLQAALRSIGGKPSGDNDADDSKKRMKKNDEHIHSYLMKFGEGESPDLTPDKDGVVWLHALPLGSWVHPEYGDVEITPEKVENMKANFEAGIYGADSVWNYEHGTDPAKGHRAAGKVLALDIKDDGLWAGVKLTDTARAEVESGEWLYNSAEYFDEYVTPDGTAVPDVFRGGALTNHPALKGILPINMSELGALLDATGEVADKEHSEPGTGIGGEPGPRTDYDPPGHQAPMTPNAPDPGVTPPGGLPRTNPFQLMTLNEGGDKIVDLKKLAELLGLKGEATEEEVATKLAELISDSSQIKQMTEEARKAKTFAEQYPEQFKVMQELQAKQRLNDAKEFAESLTKIKTDSGRTVGFAPRALETAESTYLAFSEGKLTMQAFQSALHDIAKAGVVELSERGSSVQGSQEIPDNAEDAAQMLADKTKEIAAQRNMSMQEASMVAARENPDLFMAYRQAAGGGHRVLAGMGVNS